MIEQNDAKLEDMLQYLNLEVPHYLEDEVQDIALVDTCTYDFGYGDIFKTEVYEVQLESGKTVFAANGGFNGRFAKKVYGQQLPSPEIASKVHVYVVANLGYVAKADIEEFADALELPEEYRKTS